MGPDGLCRSGSGPGWLEDSRRKSVQGALNGAIVWC